MVDRFDWLASGAVKGVHVKSNRCDFTIVTQQQPSPKLPSFQLFDADAKATDIKQLLPAVNELVGRQNYGLRPAGIYRDRFRLFAAGWFVRDLINNIDYPIQHIECLVEVAVLIQEEAMQLVNYSDESKLIAQMAIVPVAKDILPWDLVFVGRPNEGAEVKLVRRKT